MSEKVRKEARELLERLQGLPPEALQRGNMRGLAETEAAHGRFRAAYQSGECSLCGRALASFEPDRPCPHWLLRPNGFTKKDFPRAVAGFGLFRLQAYLRWLANEEGFARHINDLSDEGTGKLVEVTIRYGDCEWSFSCGEGDYLGHEGAADHSARPHFHFQMRYKHQAFVRYNDFHFPLTDADIKRIEFKRIAPDFVRDRFAGGVGMNDVLRDDTLQHLVRTSEPTRDEENAALNLNTFIMAPPGKQMTGEQLLKLFADAREKGVSVASVAADHLPDASVETFVTPGPGVVEQAPRTPRKR